MKNQICIYCSSSSKIDSKYHLAAKEITEMLIHHNFHILSGGGAKGLMGTVADTVIELNGQITGVIPEFMKAVEWDHKGIQKMIIVEHMYERKQKFLEGTDLILALPGGCGTMEELLEAITLKRLGLVNVPIIIFNQGGYYDPLISMFHKSADEQFMTHDHNDLWVAIELPQQLLPIISTLGKTTG